MSEMKLVVDEWDLVLALGYTITHRPRPLLNGHNIIEVMTDRKPDSAVKLTTWSGALLKDVETTLIEADMVDGYCDRLSNSLNRLHMKVCDKTEAEARRKTLSQVKKGPGLRVNVDDYVLIPIPSHGNDTNKAAFRPFKTMMVGWQGPYEITQSINDSPSEFMVRLQDQTKEYPVH